MNLITTPELMQSLAAAGIVGFVLGLLVGTAINGKGD